MKTSNKKIILFALAGLLGPLLGWIIPDTPQYGEIFPIIIVSIWPTWLLGWAAMGQDQATVYFIITITVVSNILVFGLLGFIYTKIRFHRRIYNYAIMLPIYGAVYGIVCGSLLLLG